MAGAQPKFLEDAVSRLEHTTALDAVAEKLAKVLGKAVPTGPIKDLASGTPTGHPLHPPLVALPIGAWTSATVLDFLGGRKNRAAARRLIALGILFAAPTAYSGASDWLDTQGAERRVGLVHAASNSTALTLYLASFLSRRNHHLRGVLLALLGGGALTVGGWLGGHLTYALGVGVDTTAFQHAPADWTDVGAETDVTPEPQCVEAAGTPILLVRWQGQIVALADRCTHRGGPLHEGRVVDGCIECPWHGSRFRLDDGVVAQGPAVRPEPIYEVRTADGRVQVRRSDEPRQLRTNPVGI